MLRSGLALHCTIRLSMDAGHACILNLHDCLVDNVFPGYLAVDKECEIILRMNESLIH